MTVISTFTKSLTFLQVLNKQHEILTKMTEEISMLDQIATFTIKLSIGLCTKLKILRAVKTECIFMVLQVLNRDAETYKHKPTEDVKGEAPSGSTQLAASK